MKGSKFERARIGKIVTIKPGQAAPLTLSWRVPAGGSEPVEVRFDGGSLTLPAERGWRHIVQGMSENSFDARADLEVGGRDLRDLSAWTRCSRSSTSRGCPSR